MPFTRRRLGNAAPLHQDYSKRATFVTLMSPQLVSLSYVTQCPSPAQQDSPTRGAGIRKQPHNVFFKYQSHDRWIYNLYRHLQLKQIRTLVTCQALARSYSKKSNDIGATMKPNSNFALKSDDTTRHRKFPAHSRTYKSEPARCDVEYP